MSTTEPFSRSGQSHVVSIEVSRERPAQVSEFFLDPQPIATPITLDSAFDRMVSSGSLEPRNLADALSEPRPGDLPELRMNPPAVDLMFDRQLALKRRQARESTPEVTFNDEPPRPRKPPPIAEPPSAASIPIEQFVGLEKDSSADLSSNRPPAYPLEAVRRGLQGVVLIQLTITRDGRVQNATVVKSSGHQILDDAAVKAVATWKGQPARRWGKAVESVERLPVRFRL